MSPLPTATGVDKTIEASEPIALDEVLDKASRGSNPIDDNDTDALTSTRPTFTDGGLRNICAIMVAAIELPFATELVGALLIDGTAAEADDDPIKLAEIWLSVIVDSWLPTSAVPVAFWLGVDNATALVAIATVELPEALQSGAVRFVGLIEVLAFAPDAICWLLKTIAPPIFVRPKTTVCI